MSFSYRIVAIVFFILYLAPIAAMAILVQRRVNERQIILHRFLQNQVEADRQILAQRAILRGVQPQLRRYLIGSEGGLASPSSRVKEDLKKVRSFFERYETSYSANSRTVLRGVLQESEELSLITEESEVLGRLFVALDGYTSLVSSYEPLRDASPRGQNHTRFLEITDEKREQIYDELNNLADLRFIFGQRLVFALSGENDRQAGFFNSVFAGLLAFLFVVAASEYFLIHKPFRDIMLFLKDLRIGKRGQRLYFSSLVKEVKESEEVINDFVGKAEEHEKEK